MTDQHQPTCTAADCDRPLGSLVVPDTETTQRALRLKLWAAMEEAGIDKGEARQMSVVLSYAALADLRMSGRDASRDLDRARGIAVELEAQNEALVEFIRPIAGRGCAWSRPRGCKSGWGECTSCHARRLLGRCEPHHADEPADA